MRKFCSVKTTILGVLSAAALLVAATAQQAQARPLYLGWWSAMYPDVVKQNDVATKVKCMVCHPGMDKKVRNSYGKAIEKALDGKKNLKKPQKGAFDAALKKAAEEKSDTEGKTFGDLLQAGDLPAKK